jgi:hypothetical protein
MDWTDFDADDHATMIAPAAILIDAARCWRQARDAGAPIQPRLSQTLAADDCAMLASVLDSLCLFYEAALGCLGCTDSAASALDCALCSTRIMLALTLGGPAPTLQ